MIQWIKDLFKPTKPGEGMIPISANDIEREYIYVGDGMMEEVIRRPEERRTTPERRSDTGYVDMQHLTYVSAGGYSSPSSHSNDGGSYDSGSCDSGGGSCD